MEEHTYRRVFLALLALAPVGLLMVAVNYRLDPANLFHRTKEGEIADCLAAGRDVPLTPGLNFRAIKQLYAACSTAPLDELSLGSSRGLQVRSALFPGQTFFHSTVPAALLQDCVAMQESFLEKQERPRQVVLG